MEPLVGRLMIGSVVADEVELVAVLARLKLQLIAERLGSRSEGRIVWICVWVDIWRGISVITWIFGVRRKDESVEVFECEIGWLKSRLIGVN